MRKDRPPHLGKIIAVLYSCPAFRRHHIARSPFWTDALLKDTDARIKRYAEAITLQSDDFLKLVERYGITWTLLPPDRPVVQLLDHLPDWRRLYADKIAVVHVRDGHTRP